MVQQAPEWVFDQRTGYYSDSTSGRAAVAYEATACLHTHSTPLRSLIPLLRACAAPQSSRSGVCSTTSERISRMYASSTAGSCMTPRLSSTTTQPLARGACRGRLSTVRTERRGANRSASAGRGPQERRDCSHSTRRGVVSPFSYVPYFSCLISSRTGEDEEEYPLNPFSSAAPPPPPSQKPAASFPKVMARGPPAPARAISRVRT